MPGLLRSTEAGARLTGQGHRVPYALMPEPDQQADLLLIGPEQTQTDRQVL